jgi:hypothetical protein
MAIRRWMARLPCGEAQSEHFNNVMGMRRRLRWCWHRLEDRLRAPIGTPDSSVISQSEAITVAAAPWLKPDTGMKVDARYGLFSDDTMCAQRKNGPCRLTYQKIPVTQENRLREAMARIETYGMKRFDRAMTYVVQVRDAPYLVYVDARTYVIRGVTGYSCGTFASPCRPRFPRFAWSMKLVRERTLPLCSVPRSDRAQILRFHRQPHVCSRRG